MYHVCHTKQTKVKVRMEELSPLSLFGVKYEKFPPPPPESLILVLLDPMYLCLLTSCPLIGVPDAYSVPHLLVVYLYLLSS